MFLRLKLGDEVRSAVAKLPAGSGNWIHTKLGEEVKGRRSDYTQLYERFYLSCSFINRRIITEGNFAQRQSDTINARRRLESD